jgi:fumarylpyruvate hydrolase
VARAGHPAAGEIRLEVNGAQRQAGDLGDMIWNVPDTIAYLSTLFTLQPGDLIFTGTPAGVAAIRRGDRMKGRVAGVGSLEVVVV